MCNKVDLILPQELYDIVWENIETKISSISYSRVIMCLSELLEGDFFNQYIKTGTTNFSTFLVLVLRRLKSTRGRISERV